MKIDEVKFVLNNKTNIGMVLTLANNETVETVEIDLSVSEAKELAENILLATKYSETN